MVATNLLAVSGNVLEFPFSDPIPNERALAFYLYNHGTPLPGIAHAPPQRDHSIGFLVDLLKGAWGDTLLIPQEAISAYGILDPNPVALYLEGAQAMHQQPLPIQSIRTDAAQHAVMDTAAYRAHWSALSDITSRLIKERITDVLGQDN